MQKLLQHLFGKTELAELSLAEVEQVTIKYPYFAAGHYLLAKKMQHAGNAEYATQLQKTSLYFNNPLWLSFQLGQKEKVYPVGKKLVPRKNETPVFNLNDFLLTSEEETKFMEETVETDLSEAHTEEAVFAKISETPSQPAEESNQTATIVESDLPEVPVEQVALAVVTETVPQQVEESIGAPGFVETELPGVPAEQAAFTSIDETAPKLVEDSIEAAESVETVLPESPAEAASFARIAETLNQQVEAAAKPVDEKPFGLSFEPYHTVDYFASQGIKIIQDVKPGDSFGTQLKSFTEWLKSMRRLPQASLEQELAKNVDDEKVKAIAAHSIEASEVLTETMAEVYIKQGKIADAIEVYNKLSLLNPSKNAYFATKIEALK